MNRLNKAFGLPGYPILGSRPLIKATIGAINNALDNVSPWTVMRGDNEVVDVETYVNIKNDMHRFMSTIVEIIDIAPMHVGYLIRLFKNKFGLLGVAYIRAALNHDNASWIIGDKIVPGNNLFPTWERLSLEVIRLFGRLPDRKSRSFLADGELHHPKFSEDVIDDVPVVYWNGVRYDYEGVEIK